MIIYQCDRCKGQNNHIGYLNEIKVPGSQSRVGKTYSICKMCLEIVELFLKGEIVGVQEKEKE